MENNSIQALIEEQQFSLARLVARLKSELLEAEEKLVALQQSVELLKKANAAKRELEEAIALMSPEVREMWRWQSGEVGSDRYGWNLVKKTADIKDEVVDLANNDDTDPANNNDWTPVNADYITDTRQWELTETINGYEVYLRNKENGEVSAIALISDTAQSWTIKEHHARSKFAVSSAKDFLLDLGIDTGLSQPVLQEEQEVVSDWQESDLDVESDDWLEYDIPEYNDGYAVYFRYDHKKPGAYTAIALIAEGETTDPRSWMIEAKFESKEGAYLEAQNFLSRIEEGEFAPEVEVEVKAKMPEAKAFSISEVIEKIKEGKSIDRISKEAIKEAATVVGVSTEGSKTAIAKQIKSAGSGSTAKPKKAKKA